MAVVWTVELLLAVLLSVVADATVTELAMSVPLATPALTVTVTKIVRLASAASVGVVQAMVAPTPQAVAGAPGPKVRLWKVTCAGRLSVSVTVWASLGPLLVTDSV